MIDRRTAWPAPLALAVAPCAFLLSAGLLRHVRGPAWLAFNNDPEYVYLFNSLQMLNGHAPFHIDHPGIPLKALGALVLAAVHAASGHGPVTADVVARPEVYLAAIQWTALALTALIIGAGGWLVWRRAGLTAALLVQTSPWLSFTAVGVVSQLRPEPLIVGLAVLWTALVIVHAERPTDASPVRLGAVTGVLATLHVAAAPLAVGAFLLFDDWRSRRRLVTSAGVAFLVAFSPALTKLPSFVKRIALVSVHSGAYGSGAMNVVDVGHYLPSVRLLLASEPVCTALILAGALTWVAWRLDGRAEGTGERRALGALAGMQIAAIVALGKHADPHYLVTTYCTLGANLWLIGRYIRQRQPALLIPLASIGLIGVAVGQGVLIHAETIRLGNLGAEQLEAHARTDELLRAGSCIPIYIMRASSQATALQMGNLCALYKGRALFGAEIAQRFPDVLFDEGELTVGRPDRQKIDLDELLRGDRCVIYAGETVNVHASPRVTFERLFQSGQESASRMGPGRHPVP